jgi:hypothetical protein
MAAVSVSVYTGIWTDWSRGPILGATLTLQNRDGVLLLAFVAAFVTLVGARLWLIARFVAHQLLADERIHDGVHFQRQSILRNTSSPLETAWRSLQQWWYWREGHGARRLGRRTLPLAALSLAYVAAFMAVAVFSAKVSDSDVEGGFRLVKSREQACGFIAADRSSTPSPSDSSTGDVPHEEKQKRLRASVRWYRERIQDAAAYAQECYKTDDSRADQYRDPDPEFRGYCKVLAVPALSWHKTRIPCPFGDLCVDGAAIRLETERVDSATHLGINRPGGDLQYIRRTECAPVQFPYSADLTTTWFNVETGESTAGCITIYLQYGHSIDIASGAVDSNSTQAIFTCNNVDGVSQFTANAIAAHPIEIECPICDSAGSVKWQPGVELEPTDRSITLISIVANAARHTAPNKDLIFGTGEEDVNLDGLTSEKLYHPRSPIGFLACSDAHQLCNPVLGECTNITSGRVLFNEATRSTDLARQLGLTASQAATALLVVITVQDTDIPSAALLRLGNFLEAQTGTSDHLQFELADNQWEVESARLFTTGLARLQHALLEFTGGTDLPVPAGMAASQPWRDGDDDDEDVRRPWRGFGGVSAAAPELARLCHAQRVRAAAGFGTLSFSVLGLGLVFGVGGAVVAASAAVRPVAGWLGRTTGRGTARGAAWERDASLQVQRLLFEERGQGEWVGASDGVPRTRHRTSLRFPVEWEEARDGRRVVGRGQWLSLSGRQSEEMYCLNPQ